MRSDIVHALMEHTFNDEVRVLCDERAAIANDVYDIHYAGKSERMEKLPDKWLRTYYRVEFRAAGADQAYYLSGKIDVYARHEVAPLMQFTANHREDVHRRVLNCDYARCLKVFEPESGISVRVQIHEASAVALAERVKNARAQAAATLDQFYTVEKLLEAWPEIKPFIPEAKRPAPALPAVPVAALNALFDLPVETQQCN
jgi:hypothetical protein